MGDNDVIGDLEMNELKQNEGGEEKSRRPYEPPSVTRFPLRPEEAVLGFCKMPSSTGPNIGNCAVPSACFTNGS